MCKQGLTRDLVYFCRVIGAMVIVIGLYMVLWGKSKDQLPSESEKDDNMELATNV